MQARPEPANHTIVHKVRETYNALCQFAGTLHFPVTAFNLPYFLILSASHHH